MAGPEWVISLLRDAAAIVPEIGECAAAVVHEDAKLIAAEMDLEWVTAVLDDPRQPKPPDRLAEIHKKLRDAKAIVAETEAVTPRGQAIKRRHAA